MVKKWSYFDKNVHLKLHLQDEGHLYVNFLISMITIYCTYLLFLFFSRGIRIHILMLTGIQNERISGYKNGRILL